MSDRIDNVEDALAHYGVKGMKWGVRRKASADGTVTVTGTATKGKAKIKSSGGQGAAPHKDAIARATHKQKLKKGGINSMSDKELKDLADRLSLEKRVKDLTDPAGKKFVNNLLKQNGTQAVNTAANEGVNNKIREAIRSSK